MIAAELVKPLDFGRAFEENVGVISLRTAFLCLAAVLAGLAQQPGPALASTESAGPGCCANPARTAARQRKAVRRDITPTFSSKARPKSSSFPSSAAIIGNQ